MSQNAPSAETAPPDAPKGASTRDPIELRVHGVSGTPPEALLDRPLVTQVGGDAIAGFYRPRLPEERTDEGAGPFLPQREKAPELEGYNWGGLTSGSPGRALWLFLLPFTLINIAPRARPNPADDGKGQQVLATLTWVFSRWLALALTLLLVVTASGIGINMAAWQCSFSTVCTKGVSTVGPLDKIFGTWVDGHRIGGLSPEWLLLVGSLVPLLALFTLWFVSKRTIDRYESVRFSGFRELEQQVMTDTENELEPNLESPWMWHNASQVRRIRATHMQAGIAAVIWIVSGTATSDPLIQQIFTGWGTDFLSALVGLITAAVLIYSFAALAIPSYVGHGTSKRWQMISFAIWPALAFAAAMSAIDLLAGDLAADQIAGTRRAALPGFDNNLGVLVDLMFALTLAVIVVVLAQAWKKPQQAPGTAQADLKPGLFGCAGALLATMAVLTGAIFSASAYTVAAAWLNTGSLKPSPIEVSKALNAFAVPETFRMAVYVFFFSLLFAGVVLVVAVAALIWSSGFKVGKWRRPTLLVVPGSVAVDYGDGAAKDLPEDPTNDPEHDDLDHNSRRRSIERAMYFGALVEPGLYVVGLLVAVGVVVTFLGAAALGTGWGLVDDIKGKNGFNTAVHVEGWGAYAAVVTLFLLVSLTSLAFRVPSTRRGVGIIWDVASFWPRACHPLAAPCYAERTVPDLTTRLHYFRSYPQENRPVILAAHSQGTVLSMAALFSLNAHVGGKDDVNGISLLTFGCVLRRLYARFFPVYFGVQRLHEFQKLLTAGADTTKTPPRWINLWRYTDYLGGQVTDGPRQKVASKNATSTFSGGLLTEPPSTGPQPWEWHAPDPPHFERQPGESTYSLPSRHSNFWMDDSGVFQLAVARLAQGLKSK